MAKRFPIGIQDFEKLRKSGFCYVDKTALVYEIANGSQYNFLSRPRRFGKSLLVSTLKAYFLGKKELFEGLAMADLEKDWTTYPVFHIDFVGGVYNNEENLNARLEMLLTWIEEEYGLEKQSDEIASRFGADIKQAFKKTGKQVVILIDEYDKPLIDNIDHPEMQARMRDFLSGLYGNLKSMDSYIRFGFLTGVSRFSHLNIFSAVNNLQDISFLKKYNSICGITRSEMLSNFDEDIEEMAVNNNLSKEATIARLEEMYDGYHFAPGTEGIFNPFTLINALQSGEFTQSWSNSGTPSFLIKMVESGTLDLMHLQHLDTDLEIISESDPTLQTPEALLYQTGYLTIKSANEYGVYTLGFPNREVKSSFLTFLFPFYHKRDMGSRVMLREVRMFMDRGDLQSFMGIITAFFKGVNYETMKLDYERQFQNILYTIFYFAGCDVENEFHTSDGRIDCIVRAKTAIYIFEYKLDGNGTADDALRQIDDKGYALPFTGDERKVVKVGVVFSRDTHTLQEWKQA